MGKYHLTNDYNSILDELLKLEDAVQYISEAGISVGVVASEVAKKKSGGTCIVYADCRKVPAYWRTFTPYDFLITVYEPNCLGLDARQMQILFLHELLHIGVDPADPLKTYVRDRDLQDFRFIVDQYGLDWNKING